MGGWRELHQLGAVPAHLAGANGALAPSHHGAQLANVDIPLPLDLILLVQLTATLPAT